jgi:hypothetical protein
VGGLAEEALGFVPREITDRVDEISGVSPVLAQFASFREILARSGRSKDAAEVREDWV